MHACRSTLEDPKPRADLDASILAASRRAVMARPSAARRFAAPVSIAAVLVLAFGVSLHMQQEKPGIESATVDPYAVAPPTAATLPEPKPQAPSDAQSQNVVVTQAQDAVAPKPERKAKVAQAMPPPQAKLQSAPVPMQAAPAGESDRAFRDEARAESERKDKDAVLKKEAYAASPPPAAREEGARSASVAADRAAAAAPAAPAAAAAPAQAIAPPPPARAQVNEAAGLAAQSRLKRDMKEVAAPDEETRELEAIAKLRAEGRHEEADKALAEFRRKRPDYRIPEAMWERVRAR